MTEQNPTFPNLWQAALIVVALFLFEYAAYAVLADVLRVEPQEHMAAGAVSMLLGYAGLFALLMRLKGLGYRDVLHPSPNSIGATLGVLLLPLMLLLPALVMGMGGIEAILEMLFPMSAEQESMFETMTSSGLLSVVLTVVLAPVMEEMLFRGLILRSFLQQCPRWLAIVWSAVLFGAAHLNLYQFAVGLVLGCVLGWLYERSRSLLPGMALHAMYNALVYMAAESQGTQPDTNGLDAWSALGWAGAMAMAFAGIRSLRYVLARRAH